MRPIPVAPDGRAERVTLLVPSGQRASARELRYHPLVREFLEARLARDHGIEAVRDPAPDRRGHAEAFDWRIAAHHYWRAERPARERYDIIDASAQSIIGRGEYLVAAPFVADLPESRPTRQLRGRALPQRLQARRHSAAHRPTLTARWRSTHAVRRRPREPRIDDRQSGRHRCFAAGRSAPRGVIDGPVVAGHRSGSCWIHWQRRQKATSPRSLSTDCEDWLPPSESAGQTHFEGITYLNLAEALRAMADAAGASERGEQGRGTP